MEDPILRQVLSTRPLGSGRYVNKRITLDTSGFRAQDTNCPPRRRAPRALASPQPVSHGRDGTISLDNSKTQALPSVDNALSGLHGFNTPPPPPIHIIPDRDIIYADRHRPCPRSSLTKKLSMTDNFEGLMLLWTNLTRQELGGIVG